MALKLKGLFYLYILKKILKKINKSNYHHKLKVNTETKEFLDCFFKKELDGIDELVGRAIMKKWF